MCFSCQNAPKKLTWIWITVPKDFQYRRSLIHVIGTLPFDKSYMCGFVNTWGSTQELPFEWKSDEKPLPAHICILLNLYIDTYHSIPYIQLMCSDVFISPSFPSAPQQSLRSRPYDGCRAPIRCPLTPCNSR